MRSRRPVIVLVSLLALASPHATRAQDLLPEEPPVAGDDAQRDASTEDYLKALDLQRKGRYAAAQDAFQKVLEKWPDSVHRADIEERSAPNHFAGVECMHGSGPSARRIDVAVMGDGFTVAAKDQKLEHEWAKLCLDVLWSEASYDEYRDYFNWWFVRLVSEDEKVDPNLTDEQKAAIDKKNEKRSKKRTYDYSTALDCKAAGPQGQVMADRDLVYRWLAVADRERPGCGDDALVIAFARFGVLGMGGGGVANVGRPDKSVTVHEFGHAFVDLLDEYTGNPEAPHYRVHAANATSDREDVPWQHFLDAKVKGVGVIEGGATYSKGVWRPAQSCAMNAAGATGYCPVCREAAVLAIYRYVPPVDTVSPPTSTELHDVEGSETQLVVTPMQPKRHEIDVTWIVEAVAADAPGPAKVEGATTDAWGGLGRPGGARSYEDRTAYEDPPPGDPSALGERVKPKKGEPVRHAFPVGRLAPGRWRVTAVAKDPTPWVLRDEQHLLEERVTWWVTVTPKP